MVLGIDLGTSNTVASTISRDGTPVLIPDAYNKQSFSTPSVALFENRKAFTGQFAENLFESLPDKHMISFFKRSFGTQVPVFFDDYKNPWFSESIASLLLKKIKYDVDMYLPDGYNNAVITVPAHYNDVQRKSVLDAARMADLELAGILEEPVAAALFYGSEGPKIDDEIILVYDFGGGTFDLTLITQSGNQLNVIAKDGVNKLGGKEFDEIVKNTISQQYEMAFKRALPDDKLTTNRLQKLAENIKIELNSQPNATGYLRKWVFINKQVFEVSFNYKAYAQLAGELITRSEKAVQRCLRSLGMEWGDINKMVLTGGTSSSLLVQNFWQQKVRPGQQIVSHQPFSSVAKGAAIYAASLQQKGNSGKQIPAIDLKGVSTYNIGFVYEPDSNSRVDLVIHRNTPLPVIASKLYKVEAGKGSVQITICQYWDAAEGLHKLGNVKIGSLETMNDQYIEVHVENRMNGTIGLKVKNADTGKDIRFEFVRAQTQHKYDFVQQKNLVDSIYLNNYI